MGYFIFCLHYRLKHLNVSTLIHFLGQHSSDAISCNTDSKSPSIPFEYESHKTLWCYVNWLSPELDLWMHGTMKDEHIRLDVKCTYWRMMADLLADYFYAKVWPATEISSSINGITVIYDSRLTGQLFCSFLGYAESPKVNFWELLGPLFLQAWYPSCSPTNSVKARKARNSTSSCNTIKSA